MPPSLLIIDDFLSNPEEARLKALKLTYAEASGKGNYAGLTSDQPLSIEGLSENVAKCVNYPLRPALGTLHLHCRLTLKADRARTGVHIDPCFYSGILYLSLPEHCRGGTDFFVHRRTKLDGVPTKKIELMKAGFDTAERFVEEIVNKDTFRSEKWQRSMRIPMRFNRLLLFNPRLFHNASGGFGRTIEDGRLVCLMFFDIVRAETNQ